MAKKIVDRRGFDRKMNLMRTVMQTVLKNLIRDAAAYLAAKTKDEALNGPAGQDYPKTGYPAGIAVGEMGFVGVNSGNLKRSIRILKEGDLKYWVFSEKVVAPYNEEINDWTRQRYGKGFFDIVLQLYSEGMLELFLKEVTRFVRSVSNNSGYSYSNPFPV